MADLIKMVKRLKPQDYIRETLQGALVFGLTPGLASMISFIPSTEVVGLTTNAIIAAGVVTVSSGLVLSTVKQLN